jgi:glycerate-2-kinase
VSQGIATLPGPQSQPRAFLRALFDLALAAAAAGPAVAGHLPEPPAQGRVLVLGAGKAAAAMAQAVEDAWLDRLGPERLSGVVVAPDGHALPLRGIESLVAGHPTPDSRSEAAARRFLEEARRLEAGDLLLMLLSGGGSALLAAPARGLTLADKAEATRALLAAGLPISESTPVRRRLSEIKGGRLALAAAPASILNLVISDVPGDDPAVVASGPTLPSAPLTLPALPWLPEAARRVLATAEPPPSPGDPRLPRTQTRVVLTAANALAAAEGAARAAGCEVLNLGADVEGEARTVAAGTRGWRFAWAQSVATRGRW